MFTDTQRSLMGPYRSTNAVNLASGLPDKIGRALMSLFSPEDTTDKGGERQLQIAGHNACNMSGFTKALFWVAISISIALLMGRLS